MRDFDETGVLDAVRAINTSQSAEATLLALTGFVERYGFERIFIGQLVNPANVSLKDMLYLSDWPEELKALRRHQMAALHDPVAYCALRSKRPFTWATARAHASQMGKRMVDMVSDFGMKDGLMFPMHALESISGGVSLGGSQTVSLPVSEIKELEMVCQTAYYHLEAMLGPFPYQKLAELTSRECQCVQLAAAGKSNWEIARILGIEEDTVKKTMRRASDKLGAVNRANAVALAIAKNQIFP